MTDEEVRVATGTIGRWGMTFVVLITIGLYVYAFTKH